MEKRNVFCPEEILNLPSIKEYLKECLINESKSDSSLFNKYGGPIWMDYSPGSYVDKDGNVMYKSNHKCEYVDKELIRIIYNKMVETQNSDDFNKYQSALMYFLYN